MDSRHIYVPNWKQRLVADLLRDKKKTAVLATLVVVGAFMGARLVMKGDTPETAAASVNGAAQDEAAADAVVQKSSKGSSKSSAREAVIARIDRPITRDLFAPDPKVFPPQRVEAPVKVVSEPTAQADEAQRQAQIKAKAKELSVQSTIVSVGDVSKSTAIINGDFIRVGQTVLGFKVVEISARACVVEKDGVKVSLEMSAEAKAGG